MPFPGVILGVNAAQAGRHLNPPASWAPSLRSSRHGCHYGPGHHDAFPSPGHFGGGGAVQVATLSATVGSVITKSETVAAATIAKTMVTSQM